MHLERTKIFRQNLTNFKHCFGTQKNKPGKGKETESNIGLILLKLYTIKKFAKAQWTAKRPDQKVSQTQ